MGDIERLIDHLLTKDYSIDTVRSIVEHLRTTRDDLMRILKDPRYEDFFQLLRPSKNATEKIDKIALTLDLFCCTHYGYKCKNVSCAFLHLCPFHIRPMHPKCTNRDCPFDHDIERSPHNRKIIEARGLSFLPNALLLRVVRASADPNRSFWVCNDYPKNTCQKKNQCDRLHFCYFELIGSCTKRNCPHTINSACQTYFRTRMIGEQDQDDIFQGFGKVLRQRKADYQATNGATASGGKPSAVESSTSEEPKSAEPVTPIPDADPNDLILVEPENSHENQLVQNFLSRSIGCPVRLISQKIISSKRRPTINSNEPIYYYASISASSDLFQKLRWQNLRQSQAKPLTVYSTIHDAHEHSEQNPRTKQFSLLRLEILDRNLFIYGSIQPTALQLDDPSRISFDRLWTYIFDF